MKKLGVSGKKSVVYFYGADDAPSCKKQNAAFDEQFASFKKAGAIVVGVRNEKGAKGADVAQKLIVDEGDAIRKEIGIKKDLGLLGGRETYGTCVVSSLFVKTALLFGANNILCCV